MHLRLLGKVVASGRTIGDVARLGLDELKTLADSSPSAAAEEGTNHHAPLVERVLEAARQFNVTELDRTLTDTLLALGCGDFVRRVAVPLLEEVGARWEKGELTVADEHLTSGLLRNLLVGMIRSRRRAVGPTILLATPSGERHELGILLVALLLSESGLGLCYLGPDLPADQVVDAASRAGVSVVGLSLVNGDNREQAVAEVRRIERRLPFDTELWLGGRDARGTAGCLTGSRALVIDQLDTLDNEFARLQRSSLRIGVP